MHWWLIWFFVQQILTYELKCPVELHRRLRMKTVCEKKSPENYSCLLNQHSKTYKESCTDKSDFVRPGQKYVVGNFRKNTDCDSWRYQPFKFWSHQLSQCVLYKSRCNEAGQVMFKVGSTFSDSVCRCDNTQGYAFVNNPKEHCYCTPSNEDCTCYKKSCPLGFFLTSDYQCQPSLSRYSSCPDVTTILQTTAVTINNSLYIIDGKYFTSTEKSYAPKILYTILVFLFVSVSVIYMISKCSILGIHTKSLRPTFLYETVRKSEKRHLEVYNQQKSRVIAEKKRYEPIDYIDFELFISKVGLGMYYPEKLEISDVMKIYKNGMPQNLEGLAIMFIKNLVMLNFTCRDKILEKYIHDITLQKDHTTESCNYQNDKNNNIVNPLDLILAVFKCSSPMLKQILATKLFMCKLAIPLVFPAVANDKMLVSVWPLRSLINNSNADPGSFQDIDVDCPCQIVSFIRFGRPTISKSKTINEVLSDQYHDTFLNKDSPLGTTKRVLSEGMIEVAWYIPSSKDSVLSKVCMFLNLRGDGEHFEEQVKLLSTISSVVVLTMEIGSADNTYCQNRILSLHQANTGIIIAIDATADSKKNLKQNLKTYSDGNMEFNKQHKFIELYDEGMIRSTAMIKNEMRNCINELIKNRNDLSLLERLHTCSADVDEYNECFSSTRKKAEGIIKMIPTNSTSTSIIEQVTPLQGKLLRTRDQKNKDVNKESKKNNMEEHLQMSMNHTRLEQVNICKHISPFMRLFLDSMLQMLHSKTECAIFVLWLKHFFDERSRNTLKFYLLKYNSDCQALKTADISAIPDLRDELDKSEYNLSVASFGFEHICREMGQIYEAICSCKRTDEKMEDLKHQLPIITVKLLLLGLPFEIVDGNVENIPIVWVKAVLRNLKDIIGDKRLLALSVLGIQSSGKSTLLNTMFGLQFAISPGRCTRGVFMQLIPVDDNHLPFQWVLAIDTEGLNAPELGHQKYSCDNELATFVIGLGDITIVNIRGENTAEVKDVLQKAVHAILRLNVANEKLNLNQSCVFVHQNVSAVDAHNKLFQKRQKFVETLDAMAIQAAAEENIVDVNSFNQVIEFDSEADVWYISDLWRRDLLMCPPNPGYSENVSNVRNALMFDLKSKNIRYLTVTDTISRIEDLLNAIKKDDFVFRFRNCLELKAYDNLDRKCQTFTLNLEKHVLEFIRSDAESSLVNCENPNDLEKVISSLNKRLAMDIETMMTSILTELDTFIDGNKFKEWMIQWKQNKQSRLREVAEKLIVHSKSEINKMEEEIRFKKMKVSEQTKHKI